MRKRFLNWLIKVLLGDGFHVHRDPHRKEGKDGINSTR